MTEPDDRLPDDIERDLTLAHSETCLCDTKGPGVGKGCTGEGR